MTPVDWVKLVRGNWAIMVVVPATCTALALAGCLLAPGSFSARASLYVVASADGSAKSQDGLSAAQLLTLDILSFIESDRIQGDAARALGLDSLKDYTIEADNDGVSRLIFITVQGPSPSETVELANQLAETTSSFVREMTGVEAARTIEFADEAQDASEPVRSAFVAGVFLASAYLAFAAIVFKDMAGTGFRNPEEVEQVIGIPVIARFPRFEDGPLARLRAIRGLKAQG